MTVYLQRLSFRRRIPRRNLVRLFWLLLAGLVLWLTLRDVDFGEVWARLRLLQPTQILALVAANLVVLSTFSARWWLLLYAQGYVLPYHKLMGYRLVAFAVSYFTPGAHFGGEPLQVYFVSSRHQVPVHASLTAVLLDKTLEMLANFTFLVIGVLLILRPQVVPGVGQGQLLFYSLLLLLIPATLLVALAFGRRPLTGTLRLADRAWQRLAGRGVPPHIYQTAAQSEEQSTVLFRRRPLILLLAAGASALSWLGIIGEFWLMTYVLQLDLTLPEAITALLAARVAILLPMPAGLGALEASQVLAMRVLGLPASAGVTLSILIRARDVLLGLVGLGLGWMVLWGRKGDR
jgi:uncharacterized protein (TIRG00374 family)